MMRRLWGMRGMLQMAAGSAWFFLPSPHHVILLCCILQGSQVQGRGFGSGCCLLLGIAMRPRCAC